MYYDSLWSNCLLCIFEIDEEKVQIGVISGEYKNEIGT